MIVSTPKSICSYETLKKCVAPQMDMILQLRIPNNGTYSHFDCPCVENCVDSKVSNKCDYMTDINNLLASKGGNVIARDYPLKRYKRKILYSSTDFWGNVKSNISL